MSYREAAATPQGSTWGCDCGAGRSSVVHLEGCAAMRQESRHALPVRVVAVRTVPRRRHPW